MSPWERPVWGLCCRWPGFKECRIKGQDNCDRFPTVTLSRHWVSWLRKQIKMLLLKSRTIMDSLVSKGASMFWVTAVWVCFWLGAQASARHASACLYIWRKWSTAGSPSVTEKKFEASTFDVCPRNVMFICELLGCSCCVFLCYISFPIIFKLELWNYEFLLFFFSFVSFPPLATNWHSGEMLTEVTLHLL